MRQYSVQFVAHISQLIDLEQWLTNLRDNYFHETLVHEDAYRKGLVTLGEYEQEVDIATGWYLLAQQATNIKSKAIQEGLALGEGCHV